MVKLDCRDDVGCGTFVSTWSGWKRDRVWDAEGERLEARFG
jgi:hypothetical protein